MGLLRRLQNLCVTSSHIMQSATTPIRIVYNCSCRQSPHHPCLNDCLEVGPPLLIDLCTLLLRFRMYNIALVTDIEKAFFHVQLDDIDCKFTCFLWLSEANNPESNFDIYRFQVVLLVVHKRMSIFNLRRFAHNIRRFIECFLQHKFAYYYP